MHIAIISYHTCPLALSEGAETGGMNTYVMELSKALSQHGHQVDIFTRKHRIELDEMVSIEKNLRLIHLPAGVATNCAPHLLLKNIEEFSVNLVKFMQKHSRDYHILHAHYYLSGLVALKINTLAHQQIPLVMTFHTLGLMKNLVVRNSSEAENTKRIEAELLLATKARQMIVNCDAEKEQLKFLYGVDSQKILTIPPGVNDIIFTKPPKPLTVNAEKVFHLLYAGRIQSLKGIDHLLYALKIVSKKYMDFKISLTIIGGSSLEINSNEEFIKLKEIARILGISSQVQFLPQCDQKTLALIYQKTHLCILPSYYESFGLVALESMACGVPAIVTSNCGISELIKGAHHASVVVPAGSPIALAKAIGNLLDDPKLYKTISDESYLLAKQYTWFKVATRTLSFYDLGNQ